MIQAPLFDRVNIYYFSIDLRVQLFDETIEQIKKIFILDKIKIDNRLFKFIYSNS